MSDFKTVIDFESTFSCTHNCLYCYNWWKAHGEKMPLELDTNKTLKILEKAIQEMKPNRFVFSGGEPFLRPDIHELIEFVHSKKIPITIISNGSLINEKELKFCKKNGVDMFEFTLLSSKREIHNQLANVKGDFSAFDKALIATQKAIQHKIDVAHVFVATKQNIQTIEETLALSYALGVRHFLFNRFNPAGNGFLNLNQLQISPNEIAKALEIAQNFIQTHPSFRISCAVNIHPCLVDLSRYKGIKFTYCGVKKGQTVYLLDMLGNIRLCAFARTNVGNILTQSFDEIINSDKAHAYFEAVPKKCLGCDLIKLCQGGCKASADNCFLNPNQADDWLKKYKP